MNVQATPTDDAATTPTTERPAVNRRRLFRGAGVLAGSAGVAAVLSAVNAQPSAAADGDSVQLGRDNRASTTTSLISDSEGGGDPTLRLTNNDGPTLLLTPRTENYDRDLRLGEMVNLTTGPMIGVDSGNGVENAYIALGTDLAAIPTPIAFPPVRVLDTRRPPGTNNIIGSSSNAFDNAHRLRAGAWLDIGLLESTAFYTAQGAYVNVTVTGALGNGYATVYNPGPRPETSAVNFVRGVNIANGGFFATGQVDGFVALRIHVTATTHVILDLTGYTIVQQPVTAASTKAAHRGGRRRVTSMEARARVTNS